jgi:hypothetical protein
MTRCGWISRMPVRSQSLDPVIFSRVYWKGLTILRGLNRRKSRSAEINSVTPCSTQRIRTLVSIACDALSPVHQVKQLIAVQQVNTGCSLASQPGSRKVVGQ